MNTSLLHPSIRNVGSLVSILGLVCYPGLANAQTNIQAAIDTGRDDLRGGNTAFISLVLVSGEVLPEQVLSTGLGGGTRVTSRETVLNFV